jgi:hypothetical protein
MAFERFGREAVNIIESIKNGNGHTYYGVTMALTEYMPEEMSDRQAQAFKNVPALLDMHIGKGKWKKESRTKKGQPGKFTQWIVKAD